MVLKLVVFQVNAVGFLAGAALVRHTTQNPLKSRYFLWSGLKPHSPNPATVYPT
jgi:hypothetical protein